MNRHLLGVPGGRWCLNTPALVIDIEPFEINLTKMAQYCDANGIALRPHAKTHKSIAIAQRQIASGAIGICCAKLGEAEILATGGIASILITSPLITTESGRRLGELNRIVPELLVVTDDSASLPMFAQAAKTSGKALRMVVDVELGLRRTGIEPGESAVDLAERITKTPNLQFVGIQGYAGHLMHVPNRVERARATLAALEDLARTRDLLQQRGIACEIVTGGGTGTFDLDPDAGMLTELQAGSYLFMDSQYNAVWKVNGTLPPFETSLFVQTTVISSNLPGHAATDAGLKAFATDAGLPQIIDGAPPGTEYDFLGDEQGGLVLPKSCSRLAPGTVITCVVPHCDPTVNLYDEYHIVRGDTLVDIWRVDARGKSQ